MSVLVEIPDPLATKVEAAAKSQATSLEHYVIEAVARTVAQDSPTFAKDDDARHPLEGFLADDPELADRIVEGAYALRALPLRRPTEGDNG